uniref:Uncharacterized protein n=1 Tax=Oryza glumipatula TaxID=40148 RepID=A0A0D9YV73_9ORYZ
MVAVEVSCTGWSCGYGSGDGDDDRAAVVEAWIRRRRDGRWWAAHAGIPRLPLAFSDASWRWPALVVRRTAGSGFLPKSGASSCGDGVDWSSVICVGGVNIVGTLGVQVTFGGSRRGCYGESLALLSVLATATPLGAVHLLEDVATGALIQLHFKRFLRVRT